MERFLAIVIYGTRKINSDGFYTLWKLYTQIPETDDNTKKILRKALANTQDIIILSEFLNSTLKADGSEIFENFTINYTDDEKYDIIDEILSSEDGFDIGLEFLISNIHIFSLHELKILNTIASRTFSEDRLEKVCFINQNIKKNIL